MSYSLFMNNMKLLKKSRVSTLKRPMRRPRTAPLITPFTCREREGEVGKLYFASYTSDSVPYFLPPVGCLSVCITARVG
jgi:hypothetical protein